MDKHASSRGDETPGTAVKPKPTNPSTKPLTKTTTPRLSTATRPTAASAAAKSSGTSSLSKPPARPTNATVRRPTSSTTTPGTATHIKRQSVSSVDEKPSGDEKSKDGIAARPKRMSLASTTSSERTATTKTVSATPARRTTLAPSTATRPSAASPIGTRKAPATPSTSRTAVTTRSRPLSSSAAQPGAGGQADKKRLSTIPASPVTKGDAQEAEHNKENALSAGVGRPVRPVLGSRKSTRSVLIEQQIREFELVNSMLQAAMASDGADVQEQQSMSENATVTIAKLKTDLAKVREFERRHGRVPTNDELEEVDSSAAENELKSQIEGNAAQGGAADVATADLQNDLAQSKAQIDTLQSELVELKAKLKESSKSASNELADSEAQIETLQSELTELKTKLEESSSIVASESQRAEENAEAIRAEHATKLNELNSLHDNKLRELEGAHEKKVQELTTGQESEIGAVREQLSGEMAAKQAEAQRLKVELDDLRKAHANKASAKDGEMERIQAELTELQTSTLKDQLAKDAEIEKLKLDLEAKTVASESASESVPSPTKSESPAHAEELADAQKKLEAARTRHMAAKENAKTKIARLQQEVGTKTAALEAKYGEQMATLKDELEQAQAELSVKQKQIDLQREEHAKIDDEMSRQGQLMQGLKKQLLDFQQAKKEESDAQSSLISELREQLDILQKRNANEAAAAAESVAAAEKNHSERLQDIETQLHEARERLEQTEAMHEANLQDALKKSADELGLATSQLEDTKASHTNKLETLQAELQKTNNEAGAKQDAHQGAVSALQSQLDEARLALEEAGTKHEARFEQLEAQHRTANEELTQLKARHNEELTQLRADTQSKHEDEVAALKAAHAGAGSGSCQPNEAA
ncbi:hypothetical protein EDD37DRAFT_665389 [Exophiala viscosa]|uniref:uncharacterized protein n=1 Tax=Exophiala viscosa TaxID=2486360 RepID=UPI00219970EF|nr:hypothetical protein EDD37DRAFT_665389 [Exophiala viscosa]